jgi:catechol 2,3-dioxygenase
MSLPDTLRLGSVALTVSDLERSLPFYQDALGLKVHRRENGTAALGAGGEDRVLLVEQPGARPAGRHAGLFHLALLHPSRLELGRALKRLALTRTPITGASDHGVSEAIYLSDPDGNGIELYADRPRSDWPAGEEGERVGMYTIALDLDPLLELVASDETPEHVDAGLALGHMHLHVGDIDEGLAFYRDVLGFERMAGLPSAAFLAAGGYHHHLGINTWRGQGVGPAPAGSVGLRDWTVLLDSPDEIDEVRSRVEAAGFHAEDRDGGFRVRDPWQMAVVFSAPQRV